MRTRNRDEMRELVRLSDAIYKHLYDDVDDKYFKVEMTTEIENWLYEGDVPQPVDVETLAKEFNSYWTEK
jgi:hypothetical protein